MIKESSILAGKCYTSLPGRTSLLGVMGVGALVFSSKGLIINYGEGGATKWENAGPKLFAPPPLETG